MDNWTTSAFLKKINQAACCRPPTIQNTYELTTRVIDEDIPGDLVECGVYAGAQLAAMWRALKDRGVMRPIHAFDSFQGCPKAGKKDDEEWQAAPAGKAYSSRENFEKFMEEWGVGPVTVHEGWFAQTVPGFKWPIALLRLDGDLYESTLTCLENLYPCVSDGGYVIVDDYRLRGCRAAVHEYFGDAMPAFTKIEGGGGPIWWRKPCLSG